MASRGAALVAGTEAPGPGEGADVPEPPGDPAADGRAAEEPGDVDLRAFPFEATLVFQASSIRVHAIRAREPRAYRLRAGEPGTLSGSVGCASRCVPAVSIPAPRAAGVGTGRAERGKSGPRVRDDGGTARPGHRAGRT